jgi:hypothetical protein
VPAKHLLWILCFSLLSLLSSAQDRTVPPSAAPPPTPGREISVAPADEDDARQRLEHDMAKKALKERQAALKTDTDRLLKMAVDLKAYVDRSNENILSVEVVKKAEEIEKLAHSVKDKMKGPN